MIPAPREPRPPAYHRARRLMLEHLRDHGPATISDLEAASHTRGSTTLHHIGVLTLTGDIRRVWGSRPTRLTLKEATP